jgi:hypothetical protein
MRDLIALFMFNFWERNRFAANGPGRRDPGLEYVGSLNETARIVRTPLASRQ